MFFEFMSNEMSIWRDLFGKKEVTETVEKRETTDIPVRLKAGEIKNYYNPEQLTKPDSNVIQVDESESETDVATNPNESVFSSKGHSTAVMRYMMNEPTISSAFNLLFGGIYQLQYVLDFPESATDKTIELFKAQMDNLNVRDFMQTILRAYAFGYNIGQIVWDNKTGLIESIVDEGYIDFEFLNNSTLQTIDGKQYPVTQLYPIVYNKSSYNLYGEGVLVALFGTFFAKVRIQQLWAVYCEKYGMPVAMAKLKFNDMKSENEKFIQDQILKATIELQKLQESNAIAYADNTMDVDFKIPTGSTAKTAYESFVEYLDKQVVRCILGSDSISIATPGKLGNDTKDEKSLELILESLRNFVEYHFNQIFQFIAYNNAIPIEQAPKFKLSDGRNIDNEILQADLLTRLQTLGVKLDKSVFIEYFPFLNDENFELNTGQTQTQTEVIEEEPETENKLIHIVNSIVNQASNNSVIKKAQKNEGILKEFLDDINNSTDLSKEFDILAGQVQSIISEYKNPKDLQNDIANIYKMVNGTGISEILDKVLTTTDIFGKDSVQTESE